MVTSRFEDIIYFKDSEILLEKIKEIETILHEMNCDIELPPELWIENKKIKFEPEISFTLPYFLSVGNLNAGPGENLPPAK